MTARWSHVGPRNVRGGGPGEEVTPAPNSVWWQSLEAAWPTAVLLLVCGGIAGGWAVTELVQWVAGCVADTLRVVVVDGRTTVVAVNP